MNLQQELTKKDWRPEELADLVTQDKKYIQEIIDGIFSSVATTKFRSAKIAILLSEKYPKKVYAYFDKLAELLENKNKILKWNGIMIIGNLAVVDSKEKVERVIGKLYNQLNTGTMITANNTIMALAKIAQAKPELRDEITKELIFVETYKYETAECSKIAAGFVLEAVDPLIDILKSKRSVIKFIKSQLHSTRRSTKQKAQELINKYSK
ncbi:MAG: hypothetical protein UT11_C0004G0006 [Berkelbacteria bacterium GW2011_GWA2_38_9]|uniref:HEAT repeat domain-containing protein n=1 Tax=Berkelbacteria bacterium GW2011_GWA2_38_9 TaxID=1618334 RepID=A0A0G0NXA2_9BACT|nr:MAG: hypothetical protein UT11_C0004G0006 [Berkelbacteria bacterium GW2011_GWA2_38_9]